MAELDRVISHLNEKKDSLELKYRCWKNSNTQREEKILHKLSIVYDYLIILKDYKIFKMTNQADPEKGAELKAKADAVLDKYLI